MSDGEERRAETGSVLVLRSCLFAVVVTSSGWLTGGRRAWMAARTVLMGVAESVGTDKVRGRPRPAKEVSRMLTVGAAMLRLLLLCRNCGGGWLRSW